MNSIEQGRVIEQKRNELAALMEKHNTGQIDSVEGCPIYDWDATVEEQVYQRQNELNDLTDRFEKTRRAEIAQKNNEELARLSTIERRLGNPGAAGVAPTYQARDVTRKGLGSLVTESLEFKTRHQNPGRHFSVNFPELDIKTLLTEAGTPGYVPANPRTDLVVPFPNRPLTIEDLIPQSPTTLQIVKWMEQVTFTNAASAVSEGGQKQESALDWDEKSATVEKIATLIPITEEQMDDVPGFMSLLENDMTLMIRLSTEIQLLQGNGTPPNLLGFLNHPSLQSQAFSTNNADTVLKCMTKVGWTGYARVSAIVMHPNNWETTRLIKGATNQDYVLGSPLIDIQPRLWGVPVVVTNAIPVGTCLAGDFLMYSQIFRKMGIRIDVSDSHDTYFAYNKLAVRAETRLALAIKRGQAFCQGTSLT